MSDKNSADLPLAANFSAIAKLTKQVNSDAIAQQFDEIVTDIYQQLLVLSEHSIFAPPEQITQYREQFFVLLYQLDFDPLFGGLVVQQDCREPEVYFEKPLLMNSLIADLLIQSDRLLYTGELTQRAQLIVQYLSLQLVTCEEGLLNSQTRFTKEQCANVFQREQLEALLDSQEQLLLGALISNSESTLDGFTQDDTVAIFYKRSLIDAADLINMPFKQAQIVEHASRLKLTASTFQEHGRPTAIASLVLTNSLILRTLSSGIFYLEQPLEQSPWQESADKAMKALIVLLDKKSTSLREKIQIAIAAVYYLQTKFNHSILEKLIHHLEQIDFEKFVRQETGIGHAKQAINQLNLLASVISTIDQSGRFDIAANKLQALLAPYLTKHWTIVILENDSVQLDSQLVEIKSKFNPYRLVYCV